MAAGGKTFCLVARLRIFVSLARRRARDTGSDPRLVRFA